MGVHRRALVHVEEHQLLPCGARERPQVVGAYIFAVTGRGGEEVSGLVRVRAAQLRRLIRHIARGCLLSKGQLEALFDMCQGPYDFILISNEPDGRARVRLNGVTPVAGIN